MLTTFRPLKTSTGITGLAVHPDPLPALKSTYTSTLSLLSSLPATSVYRQATEAITKHRLKLVEGANGDIEAVEKGLGGIVETAIEEAKAEENLVGKMIEWKA
jgi:NADH dehydrogenase (ubiquinone) 1 alpha subcomplex subunit 5